MSLPAGPKSRRAEEPRGFAGCAGSSDRHIGSAMDELDFHKMQGLGNDFVILDRRSGKLSLSAAQIQRVADRRLGVGCDQILCLEASGRADVFMRVYNADGSEVGACGNGTRAVARLIMEELGGSRAAIETTAGVLDRDRERPGLSASTWAGRASAGARSRSAGRWIPWPSTSSSARWRSRSASTSATRTRCSSWTTPRRCRSRSSGPCSRPIRCFPSAPISGSPRSRAGARSGCGSGSAAPGSRRPAAAAPALPWWRRRGAT